jgi:hypothetical protein
MIVSKNPTTTAAWVTAQMNIHHAVLVFTKKKLSDVSCTNPTSMVGLKFFNL